jgi:hypothetical protein
MSNSYLLHWGKRGWLRSFSLFPRRAHKLTFSAIFYYGNINNTLSNSHYSSSPWMKDKFDQSKLNYAFYFQYSKNTQGNQTTRFLPSRGFSSCATCGCRKPTGVPVWSEIIYGARKAPRPTSGGAITVIINRLHSIDDFLGATSIAGLGILTKTRAFAKRFTARCEKSGRPPGPRGRGRFPGRGSG